MATELYTHATHVPFMAKYVFGYVTPHINSNNDAGAN